MRSTHQNSARASSRQTAITDEPVGGVAEAGGDRHREVERAGTGTAWKSLPTSSERISSKMQDQREGQQHLVEMLALVEIAEQEALEQQAEARRRQTIATGSASHSEPVDLATRKADVGADHEQAAVREIDHAEHAEDQRQPAGDQEQQQAVLQAVQELREQC